MRYFLMHEVFHGRLNVVLPILTITLQLCINSTYFTSNDTVQKNRHIYPCPLLNQNWKAGENESGLIVVLENKRTHTIDRQLLYCLVNCKLPSHGAICLHRWTCWFITAVCKNLFYFRSHF